MTKKIALAFLLLILLASCVKMAGDAPATSMPVLFVTSTLPPTKPGLRLPTETPITASSTPDPLTPNPTSSCREEALFVEDVTYPDHTRVSAGEKFTKTWKLKNTGGCKWTGYTVAFLSGDQMDAPDSVAVPETEAKNTVEVSVDLVAPSADGSYTANFELRNAQGKSVPVGLDPTFWVKINVGEDTSAAEKVAGNCTYTENPKYVETLIELINKARADVGRDPLTVNDKLTEAAQAHSLDMACNKSDRLLHSGSDGSYTGERLKSAGYTNPYYLELLAIGLPQDAMNQWHTDKDQWNAVITSRVTEIGVGYVYSKFSAFGGYWTVDLGGK